jgi:hypothetical protein
VKTKRRTRAERENPFVVHFLSKNQWLSASSARIAEEAWDAAIDAALAEAAAANIPEGIPARIDALRSTKQREKIA